MRSLSRREREWLRLHRLLPTKGRRGLSIVCRAKNLSRLQTSSKHAVSERPVIMPISSQPFANLSISSGLPMKSRFSFFDAASLTLFPLSLRLISLSSVTHYITDQIHVE